MTQNKSTGTQNQQSSHESEDEAANKRAGVNTDKSSHDHMSREKAGKDEGAGSTSL